VRSHIHYRSGIYRTVRSQQGQWIRTLELHRTDLLDESLATPIYSDNQGCIAIAKDPVGHRRTKHIDVRYHYIRQLITHGKATIAYLPTEDMVADILTKPLPLVVFKRCIQGLLALYLELSRYYVRGLL
jgi:hypothetical protein